MEGRIIVFIRCQCIRWIWTSKEDTTNTQIHNEFSTKCSHTKIVMFPLFVFSRNRRKRSNEMERVIQTLFFFRLSISCIELCEPNLVLHNVGKRSQCRCMSISYSRTQNVNVHILAFGCCCCCRRWILAVHRKNDFHIRCCYVGQQNDSINKHCGLIDVHA